MAWDLDPDQTIGGGALAWLVRLKSGQGVLPLVLIIDYAPSIALEAAWESSRLNVVQTT